MSSTGEESLARVNGTPGEVDRSLFEREIAKELGARVAHNTSVAFDALQVSIRGAIPVSALSTEALHVSVAGLYDGHHAAWTTAAACTAGARTAAAAGGASVTPKRKPVATNDEQHLDNQLLELRTRLRNAELAHEVMSARRRDVSQAEELLDGVLSRLGGSCIADSDGPPDGANEGGALMSKEDADDLLQQVHAIDRAMDSVRGLLGDEETRNSLMEKIALAFRSDSSFPSAVGQFARRINPALTDFQKGEPSEVDADPEMITSLFNVANVPAPQTSG